MKPEKLLSILLILLPTFVHSEVLSSDQSGFISKSTLSIDASPAKTYNAIIKHIDRWWDKAHTYSGSSKNLYIEAKPMGCFCEKLNGKPAVLHMIIVNLQKNKLIRMQGGLGPLQGMGVNGALSWSIKKVEDGSELSLSYHVNGYHKDGLSAIAPAVDAVLFGQANRLKNYLEQTKQ